MTRWEEFYRLCYYTGVQMVRLSHRVGRFFALVFVPIRVLFWRLGNAARQKRANRRIREGFTGLFRRFRIAKDRVRTAWKRHPLLGILQALYLPVHAVKHYHSASRWLVRTTATLIAVAVLGSTLYYWSDTTFALALTDETGDVWGYVADERVLHDGVALAKERLGDDAHKLSFEASSDVSLQIIPQSSVLDKHEICDYLLEQTDLPMQDACGVYVDGVLHSVADSERVASRILDEILEASINENDDVEASFVETVELVEGVFLEETVHEKQELKELLLEDLRVQVSGTIQYETEIAYSVMRIPDATMYEGTERVRVMGQSGVRLITATVTTVNGVEQFSVITESEITKAPVTEIRAYGTKKKTGSGYVGGQHAKGFFVWPTEHTRFLSQQFGNEGHRGIDIWRDNMTGEDILAADGGKVVMAGEYPGYKTYGKFVIIDHGNGYRTVYAHCSEVLVKEGDIVRQGQHIAEVGNTGRSTAPHLHFEVQRNGVLLNPMKFLK